LHTPNNYGATGRRFPLSRRDSICTLPLSPPGQIVSLIDDDSPPDPHLQETRYRRKMSTSSEQAHAPTLADAGKSLDTSLDSLQSEPNLDGEEQMLTDNQPSSLPTRSRMHQLHKILEVSTPNLPNPWHTENEN
jgi:hypothetical protein